MLGDVEETIYIVDSDDEDDTNTDNVQTQKKKSEMLFVRGKSILPNLLLTLYKC